MDTALQLRLAQEQNVLVDDIDTMLGKSKLMQRYMAIESKSHLTNIFRICGVSELAYVDRLALVQSWLSWLKRHATHEAGFTYTGDVNGIVPCYNAMLLEAFVRLNEGDSEEVHRAVQWITKHQLFARNQVSTWQHEGIQKHGGCLNKTPCYIGIGKSVRALITYQQITNSTSAEVEQCIVDGCNYMLEHHMLFRKSNNQLISKHLDKLMFPQGYMLSLTDLVYIVSKRNLWSDDRTKSLKTLLQSKLNQKQQFKVEYKYSYLGYISFPSNFMSELIHCMLKQSNFYDEV